jgi:hypothetical protein
VTGAQGAAQEGVFKFFYHLKRGLLAPFEALQMGKKFEIARLEPPQALLGPFKLEKNLKRAGRLLESLW